MLRLMQQRKAKRQQDNALRADRRKLLGWTAGGGALLAGAALARTTGPAAAQPQPVHKLEGAWLVEFLVQSAPAGATPTRLLLVATANGGVVAQTAPGSRNADGSLNFLSMGIGAWVATSADAFALDYRYERHREELTRIELVTVRLDATLDEPAHQWQGTWRRRDVDAGGGVLRTIEGTVQGTRLQVADW